MELISTKINTFKYRRPLNSKRAYAIEQLMFFMGENPTDSKRFGYWCGRTKKIEPEKLFEMMSESKEGNNPQALFQWKLKHVFPTQMSLI